MSPALLALTAPLALFATSSSAAAALQGNDPTTAARNAYTACLRQFMDRSVRERVAADAFRTALPQQCTQQEQAFRESLIRREIGFRTPRSEAEETANMEVEDARSNFLQLFEMGSSPS